MEELQGYCQMCEHDKSRSILCRRVKHHWDFNWSKQGPNASVISCITILFSTLNPPHHTNQGSAPCNVFTRFDGVIWPNSFIINVGK